MKKRERVYAAIGALSFIAMAISLIMTYANAGESGVGLRELAPSLGLAFVFLVNVVLAKQNKRR